MGELMVNTQSDRGSMVRHRHWKKLVLALGAAVVLGCASLVLGFFAFLAERSLDDSDFEVPPSGLPHLSERAWYVTTEQVDQSSFVRIWQASDTDGGVDNYFQEVGRHRNVPFAVWQFQSSVRMNFERRFSGRVLDVPNPPNLNADAADSFCVDIDSKFLTSGECAIWVYWARYGDLVLRVQVSEARITEGEFLDIVASVDDQLGPE
ncbi:hypothetical protein O7608_27045 [Solwaraspora sp. WMMA2056]|uniref:hypothetical protein n=1 Tax=Solwaraspora sp. WMMA2056 TaxID=3015161 RepID=UPI00259B6DD6|nr:hypothetical protein [Solwaraspora sp. WMMA2056]WJK40042.1 hypothetical protein O7608_27045 [Solwaraspora sp. WMMA2056]